MIYLLFYDTDTGENEEWNTFYTPVEAFSTPELREKRVAELENTYTCHEVDVPLIKDLNND